MKQPHDGHRSRMRQKYLKHGLRAFSPHEVLEFALFFSIPRRNTNEIAHSLIDAFGSIDEVLHAPVSELQKVADIGEQSAILLSLFAQVPQYCAENRKQSEPLDTTLKSVNYLKERYSNARNEIVSLVSMDNQCVPKGFHVVCEGDIVSAGVSSRKIIEIVLQTNATAVIIAHNHPGGVALPSFEDIVSTHNIAAMLRKVGVHMVDHIILAGRGNDAVSFAETEELQHVLQGEGSLDLTRIGRIVQVPQPAVDLIEKSR